MPVSATAETGILSMRIPMDSAKMNWGNLKA